MTTATGDDPGAQQRFCAQCGSELAEGVRFCTQCGAEVAPQSSPMRQEAETVEVPTEAGDGPQAVVLPKSESAVRTSRRFSRRWVVAALVGVAVVAGSLVALSLFREPSTAQPSEAQDALVRVSSCVERWNSWITIRSYDEASEQHLNVMNMLTSGANSPVVRTVWVIGRQSADEADGEVEPNPYRPLCWVWFVLPETHSSDLGPVGAPFASRDGVTFELIGDLQQLPVPILAPGDGTTQLPISHVYGTLPKPSRLVAPHALSNRELPEVSDEEPLNEEVPEETLPKKAPVGEAQVGEGTNEPNPLAQGSRFEGFKTPSGNIICWVFEVASSAEPSQLECALLSEGKTWVLPQTERVTVFNETKTDSAAPVLEYGQTWNSNSINCRSEFKGLTCRDDQTGHGFFLSKDEQRIFGSSESPSSVSLVPHSPPSGGYTLMLPEGWRLRQSDGGGSGSTDEWYDVSSDARVSVWISGCTGCWLNDQGEPDPTAIDPSRSWLRVSQGEATFESKTPSGDWELGCAKTEGDGGIEFTVHVTQTRHELGRRIASSACSGFGG